MKAVSTHKQPGGAARPHQHFFKKGGGEGFFSQAHDNHPAFFNNLGIQPKLAIGKPGDRYEQEADATAEQVVKKIDQPQPANVQEQVATKPLQTGPKAVQAKCATCEKEENQQKEEETETVGLENTLQRAPIFESDGNGAQQGIMRKCESCEKEEKLQGKEENGALATGNQTLESNLASSKGGGSPLPEATRQQMETAFGADFSGVRMHSDSKAANMNKGLSAQAFTHKEHIYFNSGKDNFSLPEGKKLLAHELTHVVQQGAAKPVNGNNTSASGGSSENNVQLQPEPGKAAAGQEENGAPELKAPDVPKTPKEAVEQTKPGGKTEPEPNVAHLTENQQNQTQAD
ncbi:MAG: DUF4157 domain-containing protein, partial [Bacteroidales bacterium]|nr:DUF4157 domain-containing protein [Bacteroidales bacterium]